jgi:arylsulfatase A-like enzyme
MKNRSSVWIYAFVISLLLAGCNNAEEKAKNVPKRNIVFILADDLGWNQVGFTNATTFYETPNIDKIAAEGMIFKNAYAAASICSPSRASLMTGKYPARLNITDYIPGSPYPYEKLITPAMAQALPQDEITIAEMLRRNGYTTGHFGKWHLNVDKKYTPGRVGDPGSQGFDEVLNTEKPEETDDPENDAHKTKLITQTTLSFIEKNKDKPFFAYVSFNTVHRPLMERKQLIAKYAAKPGANDSVNNPVMGAMIETMDKGVGEILAKLDELQLADNTMVVFYSDNGGLKLLQDQRPLRGGKAMLFEGGTRVPLAIKSPGIIKPGTFDPTPVSTIDFFPTLASLVGDRELPANIDGKDLMPLLTQSGKVERDALYWHYPHYHHLGFRPGASIIAGNYKLIEWFEPYLAKEKGAVSLFDLSNDPGESKDLSAEMPEKAKELQDKLHIWQTSVGARIMTINPEYDEKKRDWRFKDRRGEN